MNSEEEVYYRIYKSERLSGKLTVVCMQWFDEHDYESKRFFKGKDGYMLKFYEKEEAVQWLLDNIKEELIDPEYLELKIIDETNYYK